MGVEARRTVDFTVDAHLMSVWFSQQLHLIQGRWKKTPATLKILRQRVHSVELPHI